MKKILLTIGLLSSTLFSTANAHLAVQSFSCTEAEASPDAAQTFSFYEVPATMGSFVEYSYSNSAGAKHLIESIDCDVHSLDGGITVNDWECDGQNFKIDIINIGERQFQAYVYKLENGKMTLPAKIFFCL